MSLDGRITYDEEQERNMCHRCKDRKIGRNFDLVDLAMHERHCNGSKRRKKQ
jgi:hypothetical protein